MFNSNTWSANCWVFRVQHQFYQMMLSLLHLVETTKHCMLTKKQDLRTCQSVLQSIIYDGKTLHNYRIYKKNTRNETEFLDWTILFFPRTFMKPEGRFVFVIIIHNVKNKVIFWSPSHQHNAHTVPTTVTESLGFGTEPDYQRHLRVTSWFIHHHHHEGKDVLAAMTPLGGQV